VVDWNEKHGIRVMNLLPVRLCWSVLQHVNALHDNGIGIMSMLSMLSSCSTKGCAAKGRVPL